MSARLRYSVLGLLLYLPLGLATGAASFTNRKLGLPSAVALQQRVWTNFHQRGAGANDPGWLERTNSGRILMPAVMAGLASAGVDWPYAFALTRLGTIVAAYAIFHWYLSGWFPFHLAVAGTLFVAATIPLTFNNWFEVPTDFPEIATFALGMSFIRDHRIGPLCLVIFMGTLNKETTIFLPLIFLACHVDTKRPRSTWMATLLTGLAWLVPYAALRWWTGAPLLGLYGLTIDHNVVGLSHCFVNWNPYNNYLFYLWLFGGFWLFPVLAYRRLPSILRRALLTTPAFLVVFVAFGGYLDEPRAIVSLYALLVPAGLFALAPASARGAAPVPPDAL
jgi:hypothetical protein